MRSSAATYALEAVLGAAVVLLGVLVAWPGPAPRPKPVAAATTKPEPALLPGGAVPGFPVPDPDEKHKAVVQYWKDKAAADEYQLKPDATRAAAVRAACLKVYRAQTVGAFEQTPGKDAPWAGLARAAFESRAKMLTDELLSGQSDDITARANRDELAAAVRVGCDDPLIVYWHIRASHPDGPPPDLTALRGAVTRVCESTYPAVRRVHAAHNWLAFTARLAPTDPLRDDAAACEARFWTLFAAAARERTLVTDEELIDFTQVWQTHRIGQGATRTQALAELDHQLRQAGARDYLRLTVRGIGLRAEGSDARGAGVAATVGDDAMRVFLARFADARTTLTAAAAADPEGFSAPAELISVCMGLGLDRAEMESAFRRALRADPFHQSACNWKLEFLHPKWHGSPDAHEYLTFAWSVALAPGDAGLATMVLSNMLDNNPISGPAYEANRATYDSYYSNPAVWSLVRTICERVRDGGWDAGGVCLNHYARLACVAGRSDVARAQFARIGNAFSPQVFADRAEYDRFRRLVGAPIP